MATDIGSTKGGIDFQSIEDEARKELNEERTKNAKAKLKDSLRKIGDAKQILANLERQHEDLLVQIKDGTI